jgi:ribosomal protein S16
MKYLIKLKPIFSFTRKKPHIVYWFVVYLRKKRGWNFIERLGFYDMHSEKKKIFLNNRKLGFWLNKGALLNLSCYKILRKFVPRKKN